MNKIFIIAEAGVNHNGSIKIAKKMIDVAAKSGADAVKFQTFTAEKTVSKFASKAAYQMRSGPKFESQLQMLKKLELDRKAHKELIAHCNKKGIVFLSTPFDLDSIDLLDSLKLKIFKIPSGEINNLPFLRKIGSLRKKVILSTGMSDMKEIKAALNILMKAGTVKDKITVLQCNTEYPTPLEHANLRAMFIMRDAFNVKIGYSDHTVGIEVPIAAAAMGAEVIEKHFTLDKNMFGPDHTTSLDPDELALMIRLIRNVEKALGDGIKQISPSEKKNKLAVRKSIVALCVIAKGDVFTESNITIKRSGVGISPMLWDMVLGKKAKKNFKQDERISL
ncbi:MAG: N-acetylneuraminate synthase [Candidatus Omnitrophota bacterium]